MPETNKRESNLVEEPAPFATVAMHQQGGIESMGKRMQRTGISKNREHFWKRLADCSGVSILEQALVYPLLLGVIIGAVDISRILQGYSVLDEGLRSALRCATPANGECVAGAGSVSEPLFDVYQTSDLPRYRVQQHHYSADAGWVSLPVHQIDRIEAVVAESVKYPVPAVNHTFQLEQYRPQGTVGYALETSSFPAIDMRAGTPLVPRLSSAEGVTAQPTVQLAAPEVRLRVSAHNRGSTLMQKSIRFTIGSEALFDAGIRDLRSGEGCFRALAGKEQVDFASKCDSSDRFKGVRLQQQIRAQRGRISSPFDPLGEGAQYAFVVLDIRGQAQVSRSSAGAVELTISQPGVFSRDLGGRRVDSTGESNFVPRGAPEASYSAQMRARYSEEIHTYQAIMIKLGVPIDLTFTLVPDNAETDLLEWQAQSVAIYTPRYRTQYATAECDQLSSRARFGQERSRVCTGSRHPAGLPRIETLILPSVPELVLKQNVCLTDGESEVDGIAALRARGVEEAESYHSNGQSQVSCSERVMQVACPDNYGHAALTVSQGVRSGEICGSEEAHRLCPLPAGAGLGKKSQICWTLGTKELPVTNAKPWVQSDCAQKMPQGSQLPEQVRRYNSLRVYSHQVSNREQRFYTAGIDPREFIDRHPAYQCAEVAARFVEIRPELRELKQESLFNRTTALGANFEQLLFLDAQRNFIDPEKNLGSTAYFRAKERTVQVLLEQAPNDPSQVYWIEPEATQSWQLLAHAVKESEHPVRCREPGVICRRDLIGTTSTSEGSDLRLRPDRGEEIGMQAISAAMPGLARSCKRESRACAMVKLEEEQDSGGKLFVARGELRIPLILSPVPLSISRVVQGRWEGEFVDR